MIWRDDPYYGAKRVFFLTLVEQDRSAVLRARASEVEGVLDSAMAEYNRLVDLYLEANERSLGVDEALKRTDFAAFVARQRQALAMAEETAQADVAERMRQVVLTSDLDEMFGEPSTTTA